MPVIQKLLTIDEVFIYRVPPIKFAGGYRAEDWDLTKPLQTCSLSVEKLDIDACLVKFYVDNITPDGFDVTLFAQCNIILSPEKREGGLEQYLENVLDSSRYFVVKIEDLKTCRTANIGVGFRLREDASNFRQILLDFYEESIKEQIRRDEEKEGDSVYSDYFSNDSKGNKVSIYAQDIGSETRKLTLMDWEQIHLNVSNDRKDTLTSISGESESVDSSSKQEGYEDDTTTAQETVDDDDISSITGTDSRHNTLPKNTKGIPRPPSTLTPGVLRKQISVLSEAFSHPAGNGDDESTSNVNYLGEELVRRQEQIQKMQSQLSGLEVNLVNTSGDLAKKEAETASLCQTLSKAIEYIETYKTRVRDLEEAQNKLESELDTTKSLNSKLKTERLQLESNLGDLVETSDRRDGKKKKKKKKVGVERSRKGSSMKKLLPV